MTKALDQDRVLDRGGATRRRIVAAAIELVAEVGWGRVTTRLIAGRAGVNVALIHYHFGSKEALLRSAVTTSLAQALSAPVELLLRTPDFDEGLRRLVASFRTMDPRSPEMVVTAEALVRAIRDEEIRSWMAQMLGEFREQLAARIETARQRGSLPASLDDRGLAVILAALLDGLLFHVLVEPGLDLSAAGEALHRLLSPPAPARTPGGSR